MKNIKCGKFVEYSDNEESYVVLVTDIDNFDPDTFSGIVVKSEAKLGYEDELYQSVGEFGINFNASSFTRIKNPFKDNSTGVIKPGHFMRYADNEEQYVVLVYSVSDNQLNGMVIKYSSVPYSGITPSYEVGNSGAFITNNFTRVKNPYKEQK